jgi:hypothetical protein
MSHALNINFEESQGSYLESYYDSTCMILFDNPQNSIPKSGIFENNLQEYLKLIFEIQFRNYSNS